MARSLNRIQLIGNLGADPELKALPSGSYVCTLNIATTESFKDKFGEWKESTDWHKVTLWEGLAETASKYLKKGNKVFVEGKLKPRNYEKDGVTHYTYDIRATSLVMMTGKGEGPASSASSDESGDDFSPSSTADDEVPF